MPTQQQLQAIHELEQKCWIKDNECHGLINRLDVLEARAKWRNVNCGPTRELLQKALLERYELFAEKHNLENRPFDIVQTKRAIFVTRNNTHSLRYYKKNSNNKPTNDNKTPVTKY